MPLNTIVPSYKNVDDFLVEVKLLKNKEKIILENILNNKQATILDMVLGKTRTYFKFNTKLAEVRTFLRYINSEEFTNHQVNKEIPSVIKLEPDCYLFFFNTRIYIEKYSIETSKLISVLTNKLYEIKNFYVELKVYINKK